MLRLDWTVILGINTFSFYKQLTIYYHIENNIKLVFFILITPFIFYYQ